MPERGYSISLPEIFIKRENLGEVTKWPTFECQYCCYDGFSPLFVLIQKRLILSPESLSLAKNSACGLGFPCDTGSWNTSSLDFYYRGLTQDK